MCIRDRSHIINFNLPDDFEIYVHRSGRTGRAGKKGISIAILHTREMRKIREIEKRTKISFSRKDVPTGMDICKTRLLSLIDKVENVDVDEQQIAQFMPDIYKKLEWLERDELIKHFVSTEFNRYLSYYKNARDINISNNSKNRGKKRRDNPNRNDRSLTSLSGYYINIGFQSKMNPGRLMGLINECLRSSNAVIGNIEIMKTFSFFEIEKEYEDKLIKSLKGKKFAGISIQIEKDTGTGKRNSNSNQKSRRRRRQKNKSCLLYTSPSPRDLSTSRMPSSA